MKSARKKPSDVPVDTFGSKTPTTPPTKAPTAIKILAITIKLFIVGSNVAIKD
jgi:hypothetical protein